jgi:hypothetical protein
MRIPNITSAKHIEGLKLELTFQDEVSGIIDFGKKSLNGVLAQLFDVAFFSTMKLRNNVLYWDGDIEIDGNSLYLELIGKTFEEWQNEMYVNA